MISIITSMKQHIKKHDRSARCGKRQTNLRKRILKSKTYGKCAITGWKNPLEIQLAHIIPKHIGYTIQYSDTDSENNCMLLANGFHSLFDSFFWTVDVFSFLDINVESETHFSTFLITKTKVKPGSGCLAPYVDKKIVIPIKYYPSLLAHYYSYLKKNYSSMNSKDVFQTCVESKLFKDLSKLKTTSEIRNYLLNLRNGVNECVVITKQRNSDVFVLWNYWSYSFRSWEHINNIDQASIDEYNDHLEYLDDPTWKP